MQRRAEAEIENVYVDPNTDPNTHDWAADLAKLTDWPTTTPRQPRPERRPNPTPSSKA